MNSPFHSPILLGAIWLWSSADATGATHEPYRVDAVPAEAYDRAVALTSVAVHGTVGNPSVTPHWLPGGDAFWYRRDAGDGAEYVLVDADTGSGRPVFDHDALAKALSTLDGETREANALAIDAMQFDEALKSVELKAGELRSAVRPAGRDVRSPAGLALRPLALAIAGRYAGGVRAGRQPLGAEPLRRGRAAAHLRRRERLLLRNGARRRARRSST